MPEYRQLTWRRVGLGALLLVVLTAVFLAYLQPDLAVDLASRIWACF